jgi:ubiquinol-cytochrome c reductase cytochrome b subunit
VISVNLVIWVWGGYRVNRVTLSLFFTLHYLLPIILIILILGHLVLLHNSGRLTNSASLIKIPFTPLYLFKDLLNLIMLLIFFNWTIINTYLTRDIENFALANPIRRPIHIQPEWYFLQYYAILRSIPNKVLGILFFTLRLFFFIFLTTNNFISNDTYLPSWGRWIRVFVGTNLLLILLGASPVEPPYLIIGQILTTIYFIWFIITHALSRGAIWDSK